jgi:hypothetical protein
MGQSPVNDNPEDQMKVLKLKVKEEKRQSFRARQVRIRFHLTVLTGWTTVPCSFSTSDDTNYVNITGTRGSTFFRLRK